MAEMAYVPHIDLLLKALRVNRDRLNSRSKIAIDARLLRALLQGIAAAAPFSESFYLETYPDLASAVASGGITDARRHFVEVGFLEGRFGAPPPVNEAFYSNQYEDVARAIAQGDVTSGVEHYMRSGAAEGRLPSLQMTEAVENWMAVLRDDTRA